MSLKWEDPPAPVKRTKTGGRKVRYTDEAAELRANPGKWALLEDLEPRPGYTPAGRSGYWVTNLRRGYYKAFPKDEPWEFRSVEGRVYARYMGD